MEVIDIDKEIDKKKAKKKAEMDESKPIIIEIQDSERIKTIHAIAPDLMEAFGIVERNSHTITQLEPEADEDDEDYDDSEQDMQYDEDSEQKVHYYAFEKDCCCGLLRLSEKPLVYLYIKPRFPLDICSMLEKIMSSKEYIKRIKKHFMNKGQNEHKKKELIRDTGYKVKKSNISEALRKETNAIYNAYREILELSTSEKDFEFCECCAVSMSDLFELYAGAVIKACFSEKKHGHGWSCHFEDGKANLLPTAGSNAYKYYIAGKVIPDIVLEKDGKYIILDVKYKDCDVPNRDDRLQLLAYADVYDAHVIGHIFPAKEKQGDDFRCGVLNTRLGKNHHYLQFCVDDSGNVSPELNDKIKKVIEGAGLM